MIIVMALCVHDAAAMPVWSPPAAPILMSIIRVKNKPAPFHLGISEFEASAARHLSLIQRQVHVLCRVSVEIVHSERAVAIGKRP